MYRPMLIASTALLAALSAIPAAHATTATPAGPVALAGDVMVDRMIVENGQSRRALVRPDKVVPGDRLVFTTSYRNSGSQPIQNFVVTNPVPPAVVLADPQDASFAVSVDGGAHWGALAALAVGDGQGGRRAATPADVTHLRWIIPQIAPGATGTLEYHATVR